VIIGPISGVIIDRVGPRRVLLWSKALGVVASLLLLRANGFTQLTILSGLHGIGMAFTRPALSSMPPRLVADEHLARTNALMGLSEQVSIVLGPVAAGVAIGLFGFKGAFVFDGLTYALGIVVLPLVKFRPVVPPSAEASEGAEEEQTRWRDAIAGWRIVMQTPTVLRVVAVGFTMHALYGVAMLAEPLYVRDVLHESTGVFAALQTAFGIFMVAGGLLAARVGERMATFGWIAVGMIGSGITAMLYLATTSVVIAFSGVALWGLATSTIWGPSQTVLQRSSPITHHGRVMAADMLASNLAMFLGLGLAGVAISAFGVRSTITVLGLTVVGVGLALGAADRRSQSAPIEIPEDQSLRQTQ
jgi:MFS family permease